MIELHGWESCSDIPFHVATPILLHPHYIVAVACGEGSVMTTIRCVGPAFFVVEEGYEAVKAMLTSDRVAL